VRAAAQIRRLAVVVSLVTGCVGRAGSKMRVSDKDVLAECSPSPAAGARSDGPHEDHATLRRRARDAIRAGTLPARPPVHMWGGPGSGAECLVCGSPVSAHEIGYELDLTDSDEAQRFASPHVHVHCFAAWSAAAFDVLRTDDGVCTISRREHDPAERRAPD
jgi:hypothetical protein